ncbi:outer membrane protein assembly factor BamD [Microbacter margulisiae]|uniref:Outer membrane protein assembly factor BamD n=1 Tax=Microbacter margulisiae TaxID=1350067 RepID=A0A7W5DSK2_9PORP|nr:outer membrane protein assembly factor BamD [Microbacter margulisiae]MBB3187809.1 outer membrane protein assembly factor BamD [Microbacter margulisiae]
MKRLTIYLLFGAFILTSCTQYQKLLKSTDNNLKFNEAKAYFQNKDYNRASQLFEDVSGYYRHTDKDEDIMYMLAECYMHQKDYDSASDEFKAYIKSYPKGQYAEDSYYMIGYCAYLNSPDPRLDQTATYAAIDAFSNFVQTYPMSDKAKQAYTYLAQMKDKLAYKELLNARLYYNLGTYMGNNYLSSVIVANNALKKYPDTKYREDLMFIVLQAKYMEAEYSVPDLKDQRYRDVIDEYYNFINEYPKGKDAKTALAMFNQAQKYVKEK